MSEPVDPTLGEQDLVGLPDRAAIDDWLDRILTRLTGSGLAKVLFVAGRIDVVYGITTTDDRRLLAKVHRPPVDVAARRVVNRAQAEMANAGFPCAEPVAGPVEVDGHWVSVETLLPEGDRGDGHDPTIRAAMAAGLVEHTRILGAVPGLSEQIGGAPAWCRYDLGAWGASHMDFFDFRTTPPAYAWLQRLAQDAADRVAALRQPAPLVVAHADWYGGNLRFVQDRLVAAFDWDLMADTEPIVAGITAGMFSAGTAADATPPTPADVAGFLIDYETAAGRQLSGSDRDLARAAAIWSIAYTARCDVTILDGAEPDPRRALGLLADRHAEYAALDW